MAERTRAVIQTRLRVVRSPVAGATTAQTQGVALEQLCSFQGQFLRLYVIGKPLGNGTWDLGVLGKYTASESDASPLSCSLDRGFDDVRCWAKGM